MGLKKGMNSLQGMTCTVLAYVKHRCRKLLGQVSRSFSLHQRLLVIHLIG